mmetsp:Transcript_10024/g.19739  ORF Transcript_10024/g.19739 Transcript_10024/m.19739 type:complete len:108 (-) Transcript_10024:33-356(-)
MGADVCQNSSSWMWESGSCVFKPLGCQGYIKSYLYLFPIFTSILVEEEKQQAIVYYLYIFSNHVLLYSTMYVDHGLLLLVVIVVPVVDTRDAALTMDGLQCSTTYYY